MQKQKQHIVPITRLLARNSTTYALNLLKKHGTHAQDHKELEYKLAEIYSKHPDKIEIEKQFAEIHPHKDIILRHFAESKLSDTKTPEIIETQSKTEGESTAEKHCCRCNCDKNNFSNAEGQEKPVTVTSETQIKLQSMAIGIVAIVAIVAIVKILHTGKTA